MRSVSLALLVLLVGHGCVAPAGLFPTERPLARGTELHLELDSRFDDQRPALALRDAGGAVVRTGSYDVSRQGTPIARFLGLPAGELQVTVHLDGDVASTPDEAFPVSVVEAERVAMSLVAGQRRLDPEQDHDLRDVIPVLGELQLPGLVLLDASGEALGGWGTFELVRDDETVSLTMIDGLVDVVLSLDGQQGTLELGDGVAFDTPMIERAAGVEADWTRAVTASDSRIWEELRQPDGERVWSRYGDRAVWLVPDTDFAPYSLLYVTEIDGDEVFNEGCYDEFRLTSGGTPSQVTMCQGYLCTTTALAGEVLRGECD